MNGDDASIFGKGRRGYEICGMVRHVYSYTCFTKNGCRKMPITNMLTLPTDTLPIGELSTDITSM